LDADLEDVIDGVFSLDQSLADECLERLRLRSLETASDVASLIEAMGALIPQGTTAKLEALDRGQTPFGAQPAIVAELWMEHPAWSWTCWPLATLAAGLVNTSSSSLTADVVALRRVDPGAPIVDFHSAVLVSSRDDTWLCDPYFGMGPVDSRNGGAVLRPGVMGEVLPGGEALAVLVGMASNGFLLHYKMADTGLSPADVSRYCELSATSSGLPNRRRMGVLRADGLELAQETKNREVVRHRWNPGPHRVWGDSKAWGHRDWEEATAAVLRDGTKEWW